MIKMKVSAVLICLLYALSLSAQRWVELAQSDANFYLVQEAFEQEWAEKEYERGQGYKQFKRWEYFMEPRTYPSGERFEADIVWEEYRKQARRKLPEERNYLPWTPLGPSDWSNGNDGYNPGVGRINVIAVDPQDSNTIFIGAPSGGLWKSEDSGGSWEPLTDHLPNLGISAIAIHPEYSDIIYIGTGDGDGFDTYSIGVWKTTNGGQTWSPTAVLNPEDYVSRKLRFDPDDPEILFAVTDTALYRSTDAGASWTEVLAGNMRDLEFHPTNSDTVYACSDALFRSVDGGISFSPIIIGLPHDTLVNRMSIAVSPDEPRWLYVLAGKESNHGFLGLYRSTDAGETFSTQATSPNVFNYGTTGSGNGGQSWYDMALAVDPNNANLVLTGGINIWKSTNGGVTLDDNTQWYYPFANEYVHADIHTIDYVGGALYTGTDGGIFRSNDNGQNWTDLTVGLGITQFYRFGSTPLDADLIIGGTQDNGTNIRENGSWKHVFGADGMEAIINYRDSDTMYMATQRGGLRRSTDGGNNFSSIRPTQSESGEWVTPYVMHPTDPNRLIAAYENVWRSTNAGNGWTKISTIDTDGLNALAISENTNYIYTSSKDSLYRTTNAGGNWSLVSQALPELQITYIAVHPDDPEILWVTFSGFTAGDKVFRSLDGGDTWENFSAGLPNLPANCVVHQASTDELLYVGTDMGVYYRDSTMSEWLPLGAGLPNVIVYELEIHYASGKLRAATHGRGIWEVDLVVSPEELVIYVASDATGAEDGTSWSDAYSNLQDALDEAALNPGKEIWIKTGTYVPHPTERSISFVIPTGTALYGGFAGSETQKGARDIATSPVHLSGEVGTLDSADNSFNVVLIDSATEVLLADLSILGGHADGGLPEHQQGGGIYCLGAVVLDNVAIKNNYATGEGSALYAGGSAEVLLHDVRTEVNSSLAGPAISNEGASRILVAGETRVEE